MKANIIIMKIKIINSILIIIPLIKKNKRLIDIDEIKPPKKPS